MVICILRYPYGIYLIILASNKAHGTLDLQGALKAEGYTFFLAEQLKCVAVNAGMLCTYDHCLGLYAISLGPRHEFLQSGGIVRDMFGVRLLHFAGINGCVQRAFGDVYSNVMRKLHNFVGASSVNLRIEPPTETSIRHLWSIILIGHFNAFGREGRLLKLATHG